MVIHLCDNCNQRFSAQSYDSDYVHECNSGNAAIDNEDLPNLDNPNWHLQGYGSKVGGQLYGTGELNVDSYTARGNRLETHKTRQYFHYNKW